ncbi:hypothetical protein HY440_02120 [Candidatus Microgenomates bacterium]|nr:hypothetical protein [Candidatus Microgenomates bacterium]
MNSTVSGFLAFLVGIMIGGFSGYYLANSKTAPIPAAQVVTREVTQTATEAAKLAASWKVILKEQNNSGEAGVALLTAEGGKTRVILTIVAAPGASASASQPAHIHIGACPTPGPVKYPLSNVVGGVSDTVIDTTIDNLKSLLPLSINVHKSATEIGTYVACGDL